MSGVFMVVMKKILMFLIPAAVIAVVIFLLAREDRPPQESEGKLPPVQERLVIPSETIKCKYYDETKFQRSVNLARKFNLGGAETWGGIVPHHLLADSMIATFFETIAGQKPEVVVVIGPNHKAVGDRYIYTGEWNWETPFGILRTDSTLVKKLVNERGAEKSKALLEEEHSISILVPYIKRYMPQASIVPILLHGNLGLEESAELGRSLEKWLKNRKHLIISSVDFSHYLPLDKAEDMDKITLKAIREGDLRRIAQMDNSYIDSPPSLIALLSALKEIEADKLTVLEHSNSSLLSNENSENTTSYYTIVFHK